MVGSWVGTETDVGRGLTLVCNLSLLISSQSGGSFSGTYQISGGTGCSSAGNMSGTVTTTNQVSLFGGTTVGNGSACTDSNLTQNGVLSGRTLTQQQTFTRTCTTPPPGTFVESQTMNLTKQ
jgi:hypothetical protein